MGINGGENWKEMMPRSSGRARTRNASGVISQTRGSTRFRPFVEDRDGEVSENGHLES